MPSLARVSRCPTPRLDGRSAAPGGRGEEEKGEGKGRGEGGKHLNASSIYRISQMSPVRRNILNSARRRRHQSNEKQRRERGERKEEKGDIYELASAGPPPAGRIHLPKGDGTEEARGGEKKGKKKEKSSLNSRAA